MPGEGVRLGPAEVLVVLGGAASGGFAAYCYYNDPWRPLAHTFGPWIVLGLR